MLETVLDSNPRQDNFALVVAKTTTTKGSRKEKKEGLVVREY